MKRLLLLLLTVLLSAVPAAAAEPTGPMWITIGSDALNTAAANFKKQNLPFTIHQQRGGVTLAKIDAADLSKLSEFMHDEYHRCAGFAAHMTYADAAKALNGGLTNKAVSKRAVDYTIDKGDIVTTVLPDLAEENILSTIQSLSGFTNRYYRSLVGKNASIWIRDHWADIVSERSDITVENLDHEQWDQHSVILTIPGSDRADEVVVLGGHLDSIVFGPVNNATSAPGADDNASGIATLTEVIRALVAIDYRPSRTVKFMGYAAEEVGLLGSREIAQSHLRDGINVVGVLQLDMTNYNGSETDITLINDFTNEAQNTFVGELIDTYTTLSWGSNECGYACSDHAAWTENGFAASFPFEADFGNHNPAIHTQFDTLGRSGNNASHAVKFAKVAAAYAVEMGKGQAAVTAQTLITGKLLYPWVSQNDSFESTLILNNYGTEEAKITLTATRGDGSTTSAEATVKPMGFMEARASDLFAFEPGAAYSVLAESTVDSVRGRWVTFNKVTPSGSSPSQGVALQLLGDSADKSQVGQKLSFGYLPITDATSAPVIVNTGTAATAVTLRFFNSEGVEVVTDTQTLTALQPMQPFAVVTSQLLGDINENLHMVAESSSGDLAGVVFVFNGDGEPAIGNATTIQ